MLVFWIGVLLRMFRRLYLHTVRQRTLLDISRLPMEKILVLKAALQGKALVDWNSLDGVEAKDFGLPYVVTSILEKSGVREVLGEEGQAFWPTIAAMVAHRIDSPCYKYSPPVAGTVADEPSIA